MQVFMARSSVNALSPAGEIVAVEQVNNETLGHKEQYESWGGGGGEGLPPEELECIRLSSAATTAVA